MAEPVSEQASLYQKTQREFPDKSMVGEVQFFTTSPDNSEKKLLPTHFVTKIVPLANHDENTGQLTHYDNFFDTDEFDLYRKTSAQGVGYQESRLITAVAYEEMPDHQHVKLFFPSVEGHNILYLIDHFPSQDIPFKESLFDFPSISNFITDCCTAFSYLHDQAHKIHNDMGIENIVTEQKDGQPFRFYLIDFVTARPLHQTFENALNEPDYKESVYYKETATERKRFCSALEYLLIFRYLEKKSDGNRNFHEKWAKGLIDNYGQEFFDLLENFKEGNVALTFNDFGEQAIQLLKK